jgi:hypothetical protein
VSRLADLPALTEHAVVVPLADAPTGMLNPYEMTEEPRP